MKRGTCEHVKTLTLASMLNVPRWGAVGILEYLWQITARNAPGGNIGKWTDEQIAYSMDWKKSPSLLIDALVKCGWIDRVEGPDRLIVHDWHDHSDGTCDKYLADHNLQYANGNEPRRSKKVLVATSSNKSGEVATSRDKSGEVATSRDPCARAQNQNQNQNQNQEEEEGGTPPPPVGDEAHRILIEVFPTLTWEKDRQVRNDGPGVDFVQAARECAMCGSGIVGGCKNPVTYWRSFVKKAAYLQVEKKKEGGGGSLRTFKGLQEDPE